MQAPTGTVTLVFTDIEGSTLLWERHGDAFAGYLAAHNKLISDAAARLNGYVVKTEGDAFFLVFKRPLDAANFAVEVQRGLSGIHLPHDDALRVRIGIHMGDPLIEFDRAGRADYFGPAVNRAARISAAGHGGQTLLSLGTAHAVRDDLGKDCELTELGAYRLKGIEEPEFIHQLVPAEAPVKKFGHLRTAADNPTNLPAQTTTFVGREGELKALRSLLLGDEVRFAAVLKPVETLARQPGVPSTGQIVRDTAKLKNRGARMLTLTGPGGCGKTRLAVALASDVLQYFPDGVWFADLSEVHDETALCEAVMSALNNQLRPGKVTPAQQVAWALEHRHCLLVLDTFERVAKYSKVLATWMRTAPRLKLLVTSRELLRVEGEVEYQLGPLAVPEITVGMTPAPGTHTSIASFPAVQLFLERASQAKPGFTLTPDNMSTVSDICRRLDGVPLGIELAAARLNVMSPQQLLQRLQKGFDVVASRGRDRHSRQTNLHEAIYWSYGLLDAWEKTVLLQLAVFAGPFTLESAEAVIDVQAPLNVTNALTAATENPPDVMDVVFGLRDKSLLSLKGDDDRYLFEMLGSVREFARKLYEEITPDEQRNALYERHARHFTERLMALKKLFQNASGFTAKPSESWGLSDGLQAAEWALGAGELSMALNLLLGSVEGLELAGRKHESQQRISLLMAELRSRPGGLEALEKRPELQGPLAAFYAKVAAVLINTGDLKETVALARAAQPLARAVGDARTEIAALMVEGLSAHYRADPATAQKTYEQALHIARTKGFKLEEGKLLSNFGMLYEQDGKPELMRNSTQEALNIFTRLNYRRGQAMAINNLGVAYDGLGDIKRAEELYRESLKIKESLKDFYSAAQSRGNIAMCLAERLDFRGAMELLPHVVEAYRNAGDRPNLGVALARQSVCQAALGMSAEARQTLAEAAVVLRDTQASVKILDSYFMQTCTLKLLGDGQSALSLADQAVALAAQISRKDRLAVAQVRRLAGLTAADIRQELPALRKVVGDANWAPGLAVLDAVELLLDPKAAKPGALQALRNARMGMEFVDVKMALAKVPTGAVSPPR
ncbi:MAG: tetratricopeptide repeat protein [Planctomycetes bacterium]|nr:tetratricopeptide repeat protein [Planctomycetota bacterium]